MSADFWAGYISGAAGIIIGNPLDLLKVRLQAGRAGAGQPSQSLAGQFESAGALIRGVSAPVLGYGALNALLFVSYNRTLSVLAEITSKPSDPLNIWCAGAAGGLATWVVSAPTELIKCCAQVSHNGRGSWTITKQIWRDGGLKAFYTGGAVTSARDAIGYGFYFWSYELSRKWMKNVDDTDTDTAAKVLLCGGLAGIVTWASIFPLDVIKTRLQIQVMDHKLEHRPRTERDLLLPNAAVATAAGVGRLNAFSIAKQAYAEEGFSVFFRGLGICSARAFLANAVQWAIYEWVMKVLNPE